MMATPQKEHEWLQQLVGEWRYEHEAAMEPGQPKQKFVGTERVRSIGGLWVVCEGQGDTPGGGTADTIMTIGYDPQKGRYVGTFIGSMMTHLWPYEGKLDADGRALVLDSEGPSFAGDGKMAKYKDTITIVNDGHRTLTSQVLGDDGKWTLFMEAQYWRVTR